MKRVRFAQLSGLLAALVVLTSGQGFPWGDAAHIAIARASCRALPEGLGELFRANEDFLAYHSLDPDIRANKEKALPPEERKERYGHYIDIDLYGRFPFPAVPHSYEEAVKTYGEGTVRAWGVLPWRAEEYFDSTVSAMKADDWEAALLAAANLSHYIGDAHVPLHLTYNYNGQYTGNYGVHARFDVELAKRVLKRRELSPGIAEAGAEVADVAEFIFGIIPDGYIWVDNILRADSKAKRGREDYDEVYYSRLEKLIGDLAHERMSAAARNVARIWLRAWVEAGKPKPPADLKVDAEYTPSYPD